jgi:uncharacterized membrane protein YfcA
VYGGYFNGGVGILLLAVLGAIGLRDLQVANGVKNYLSVILTAIAVLLYAADGLIVWPLAIGMMMAAALGGAIGGGIARKLPPPVLRGIVVITGLAMSAAFFLSKR